MAFNFQPVLQGKLLSLRPLQADDYRGLFAVASDPLIWEQHPDSDRYQEPVFKKFFQDALQSGGALSAIDARNGRIIGSSRFHAYTEQQSEVEIGYTFLARSYWGGPCNGEMKQLMLQHAFQSVNSVVFVIGTENVRSRKAVEKIGAVYEGIRPVRGHDRAIYRIVKPAK